MTHIDRLSAPGCVPTHDDILRCRQRTTGIATATFPFHKYYFNLVDVGGQKTERRKWPLVAENPTGMLFFASLIDFDLPLPGDEEHTRMEDSLDVWDEMVNGPIFENATCILFLNKSDLFEDKIERVKMKRTFPDYRGGHDFDAGAEYIAMKYIDRVTQKDTSSIYVHITCAIDTNAMNAVFDSVTEQIFKQRLASAGLIKGM
eukprot:TRINITY_DN291_c0_g2_i2.p1 TRINITY_DN291_c0_g2~~TRINITY_DN291_c0_g2_i2.p1  ORF type:complete len:203 (-),score=47.90 TRINITY_DN291_c0_g2_i2:43-651(-)